MERPYVFVNMAITLDGKIAAADRSKPGFTSEADRREMDRLRAEADVVVWGAETLRDTGLAARIRDPALAAAREAAGRPPQPANAVLTASGRLPGDAKWFEGEAPRLVFTGAAGAPEARRAARGRADVVVLGEREVPAGEVLGRFAERGLRRVLVEGGGGVHWHFLSVGLVDTLHVTLTPWLAGGREAPTLLDGEGFPGGGLVRLRLEEVRRVGEELFLRYAVAREGR